MRVARVSAGPPVRKRMSTLTLILLTAYRFWRNRSGRVFRHYVYPGRVVLALLMFCVAGVGVSEVGATPRAVQVGSPEAVGSSPAAAVESDSLRIDSRSVDVRSPGDERFDAYETDDTYDYVRETTPEEDQNSLIMRLLRAFLESITATAERRALVDFVLYGLVALAIGYGLLAIIRMEPRASRRRATSSAYQPDGLDERVKETDFEPLIEAAINNEEYRSGLRLMYLHGLQQLDRSGWIDWVPDRTNLQYERSLTGTAVGPSFREATRIFDSVWYGDRHVSATEFEDLRRPFDAVRAHAEAERGSDSESNEERSPSAGAKKTQPTPVDAEIHEPTSRSTASSAGGEER